MEKMLIGKHKVLEILFTTIVIICLFQSCRHAYNEDIKFKYSKTQQRLFDIINEYNSEYSLTRSQSQKDSITTEYLLKFVSFLQDSLGRRIDSMLVTVDTVTDENLLVTTKFNTGSIQFKFGLRFLEPMDSTQKCVYNFLTDLKHGKEVLINFNQLGKIELGSPDESSKSHPTLIISAIPEPTQAQLTAEKYKLRFKEKVK